MIAHILLLPHAETRAALLAPGAPMSEWLPINATRAWGWVVDGGVAYDSGWRGVPEQPPDLVLARDGTEVYEGTDRAGRVSGALVRGVEARVRAASLAFEISVLLGHEPGMDPAVALERLRSIVAPLGTILLLDADGREVSDV